MKKILLVVFLFVVATGVYAISHNSSQRVLKNENLNIIRGIPVDQYIRIPVPDSLTLKSVSSTKIVVNYHNFTPMAKTAFQYAVDIWSKLVTSSQTIYMDAYWKQLGKNVLGSCGPTNYYMGYNGMLFDSVYFPSAVAEKLTNSALNVDGEADLIANFSSNTDWYLGTDGETPSGKYDLITVVLHELCHGLGFTGSFNVTSGLASWGWGTEYPFIFDHYLVDQQGKSIIDTTIYPNNSAKLKTAVTSGDVYFSGSYLLSSVGKRIALYTPTSWEDGSSIYHVNTNITSGNDRLMLPAVNTKTSIHDPGKIAQGILGEIGWKTISIDHDTIVNSEKIADVKINVTFSSDFTTTYESPFLHYSIDGGAYSDVSLTADQINKNDYSAIIPISKESNVSYYISVKDKLGRLFKQPLAAPARGFHFYYGRDTIAPSIKHYPNTFLLKGQDSIFVEATINDDFGIDTVWVTYRYNDNNFDSIFMVNTEKNKFSATIPLSSFKLKVNDSVEYRIAARDISKAHNIGYYPNDGYISMKVEEIPDFISEYQNDFNGSGHDFILQGFDVTTADGFESGALNSKHPYEFAGDNSTLNYIAQFRYPIKISLDNYYLSFDEIALVEPGESGTQYGDQNFYDYVVVEGSKDNGKNWLPFEPGWDCRRDTMWEQIYNQSVIKQYSQAKGTPSLYRNHLIDLKSTGNFASNDTVLVRFRLFSDPFAYGWGWAVDNLKIQTKGLSSKDITYDGNISIYPNPVSDGKIYFNSNSIESLKVKLLDLEGRLIYKCDNCRTDGYLTLPASLKGIYIIHVENKQFNKYFKLLVK
jgi:hypothetical protein